jgi:serine/threonine protein kinase
VALKFLRHEWTGLAMAEARARLLREAQAMAQLSHPNRIAVYDAGELDGEVHLAMEEPCAVTLVTARPTPF